MVQPWPKSLVSSPGASPWLVRDSDSPLVRLLKTEAFCLFASLQSSYTPNSGNPLKKESAMYLRPPSFPRVCITNSLVSLSPDSQLLPGPRMDEHHRGGGGRGCWSQLPSLRVFSLRTHCPQPSWPHQLSTAFTQMISAFNWTFPVFLDESAGLLQTTPYHLQQQTLFEIVIVINL